MEWSVIVSIVSLIAAVVALLGVIYAVGVWRGRVDNQLRGYTEARILDRMVKLEAAFSSHARLPDQIETVLDRLTRVETKLEVVWMVFSEHLLSRPELASRSSGFKLSDQANQALAEVQLALDTCHNPHTLQNDSPLAEKVLLDLPAGIGMETLREIAAKHHLSIAELLAIVSAHVS